VSEPERPTDPELARLLLEELRRNEAALGAGAPMAGARRAVHTLKGSAGVAGQRGLAESLARIERRLSADDGAALADARLRVAEAIAALAAGKPIPSPAWPDPPDDLSATSLDPAATARYVAEMADRLERLDGALAASGDDMGAALAVFRDIHAMKGAALAVADEVTAWFCHGLEDLLRRGQRSEQGAREALSEIARWRGLLAEMIVAPERALEALRLLARPSRLPSFPPAAGALPLPPRRPEAFHGGPASGPAPRGDTPSGELDIRGLAEGDATLRVPTATIDRLFERVRQLGQARAEVADGAALAQGTAIRARALRMELTEALRLIGPPKPWGAPAAALRRIEQSARDLGAFAERLAREGGSRARAPR
jgi:two-component system chemotaxis sensor kinase CheA